LEEKCGTVLYAAPEVFKANYNEKCDVWSTGVVLFVMLSGNMPFAETKEISAGDFTFETDEVWKEVSDLGKKFISDLLTVDCEKRPSCS